MHRLPFIRIGTAIASGIIFHAFFYLPQMVALSFIGISFLGCVLFAYVLPKEKVIAYNRWLGISIIGCIFFSSYLYSESVVKPIPTWNETDRLFCKVRLDNFPQERENSYRVPAELIAYVDGGNVQTENGKLLLYFSKDADCKLWEAGDEVIFSAPLNRIEAPKNPGEFDLAKYNARKGIYYRAYVKAENVMDHKSSNTFSVYGVFHKARKYLMSLTGKQFHSANEKALADALIFGYQEDLDEETVAQFSSSGTSHVLAVSGLHVGILWLVLDKLLFFFDKKKWQRIFKFFLCLAILWAYAMLTGLSPSVMRSAIMFSGFAFAGLMKERYSSLNILFVSASIQMLIDPYVIFNIGFQLSYSAVASIVIFYKPIRDIFYLKRKIPRLIWESAALTLSAQILTTPISLYWFGQFPVYFLFANLILVPLSSLALLEGLAAYAFVWLPYVSDFLFWLFDLSLRLMHWMAGVFASLPSALLFFNVKWSDALLLYFIVLGISMFLYKKTVYWFKATIIIVCCFFLSNVLNDLMARPTAQWIIYDVKQGTVLRYISKHRANEYISQKIDKKTYAYSVKPSDRLFDIHHKSEIQSQNGFLCLGNKNILLLQKNHLKKELDDQIACDWIIFESMKYIDFNMLQHNFKFNKLIASGGNSKKSKSYWQKECKQRGIDYYDLAESGALLLEE